MQDKHDDVSTDDDIIRIIMDIYGLNPFSKIIPVCR